MGNEAEKTDPVLNRGLQARAGQAGVEAKLIAQPGVFELSMFEGPPFPPRGRGEKKRDLKMAAHRPGFQDGRAVRRVFCYG
jgi:hypothetical protein